MSTRDLLELIDASPSPYHAAAASVRRLEAHGFTALDEREPWDLGPGAKRYVVRGGASVVAFECGAAPPERGGFLLIGAHTDSPGLRVKPNADVRASGYRQVAIEVYGGVLQSTWLDRDLGVAGRVALADGTTRLVRFARPICRIPNLAIHLNREVNTHGLQLNAQTQLMPLLGMATDKEAPPFKERVAQELGEGLRANDLLGWELCLFDSAPSTLIGDAAELISAPRLDNLGSCHAALVALTSAGAPGDATRVVALYDHEEVGSQSAAGARSRFLTSVLERVAVSSPHATSQAAARAFARSFLLSADMAHAIHPNYADKHDKEHAPRLGGGPVIKVNANQSYASDGPGIALFARACASSGVSSQRFVSRNDLPCGSTIGPITAARMGIRAVDVGNPMLAMHSCRELAAAADVSPMIQAMTWLFTEARPPAPSC